jgi:hypothetical protein
MSRKKHLDNLKRQKKRRDKAKAEQEQFLQQARNEFLGPFVDEYRRVCELAMKQHALLIGIFECPDDIFYDLDTTDKLAHFGFGQFQELLLDVGDQLDFDADPTTRDGTINKHRPRPTGVSVTGYTSVVTDGANRRVIIFLRDATGGSDDAESTAALKLTALLHELGHVTDIEQGINYRETQLDLVNAEIFAHHHACRQLINGRYRLPLGYYLDGIEEMANSQSEYVRLAAKGVVESSSWADYKAAVSPFY